MNEPVRNEQAEAANDARQSAIEQRPGDEVYTYAAAGVTEREGRVPLWLWLVVVALLVWGVYYLVVYWNAPSISA